MVLSTRHLLYNFILCFHTALFLLIGFIAKGQNYFCDFENVSKSSYTLDTILINGYYWALNETTITTHTSDMKNGQKSARLRHSAGNNTFMTMVEDKINGLGFISFLYARSDFSGDRTGNAPELILQYSTDQGNNWISIDTISFDGVDTLSLYQSDNLDITGNIRIRLFTRGNGTGKRINIDDLLITPFVIITHVSPVAFLPEGEEIDPATDSLVIVFDHDIIQGSGKLTLYNRNEQKGETISFPSAQVYIKDSTAYIRNILLKNHASYFVLLDEGCFTNSSGLLPNYAIEDTALWTFTTADTSSPEPFTDLQESFTICDDTAGLLGLFRPYSITGIRHWKCSSDGREDSAAVSMLGGIAKGIAEENTDWLISRAPFDFSGMPTPVLSLWQKRRYDGHIERDMRISTDYKGKGAPEDAHWEILEVQAMTSLPAFYWTPITGILLDSLKHKPFYLAFTYRSTTEEAFELLYDDMTITNEPLNLSGTTDPYFKVRTAGTCGSCCIPLYIYSETATSVIAEVIHITGKKYAEKNIRIQAGVNKPVIEYDGCAPGIYVIRITHNGQAHILKYFVP